MTKTSRAVTGCLVLAAVVLAGLTVLILLNRDSASESLRGQAKRARIALFRAGEVASIRSALEAQLEVKPDVLYDASGSERILRIAFCNFPLPPEQDAARDHARRVAVLAAGATAKHEDIDVVSVAFQECIDGQVVDAEALAPERSHRFELDELGPDQR